MPLEPFSLAACLAMLLIKDSSELKLHSKLCSHHLSSTKYDIGVAVIQTVSEVKPFISSSLGLGTLYRVGTKQLKISPKVISRAYIP